MGTTPKPKTVALHLKYCKNWKYFLNFVFKLDNKFMAQNHLRNLKVNLIYFFLFHKVVEIVSSSSGDESSSSTSDSDDCIMLSDSEVPPSPEAEDDPNNSGKVFCYAIPTANR